MYHGSSKMNIAVFLFSYPVLSETFVINELFQLEESGVKGAIWREQSNSGGSHPKAQQLKFPIFEIPKKVFGKEFFHLGVAHLWWFARNPWRYCKLVCLMFAHFPNKELLKLFFKSSIAAQQVLQRKSEVVYVHESDRAFLLSYCAAYLCQIPLVLIFHTYYLFVEKKFLIPKVKLSDHVVFQSGYSLDLVAKLFGNQTKKVKQKFSFISSPGIDTEFFSPSAKTTNQIAKKKIKIVSIGRLAESKGFPYLFKAIAMLKKDHYQISCQIIGEGEMREQLEKLIKKLKLTKNVKLLGAVPHTKQLIKVLRNGDIFVLPSVKDRDGMHDVHANAVKEAMSAGVLVVTSRLGGIDEVIEDGEDGFLTESCSSSDIFRVIKNVLALSPQQRAKVKKAARQKILRLYSAELVTKQLINAFQKVRHV
jgi:colanic acid/amylovoran biosynthesis glycosyltransferase